MGRLKDKMAGLTFKIGSFIARTANLAKTQPEVLKRCISTTAVKFSSPYDHPLKTEKYHEGKFFSDDVEVANEMALAVGKEDMSSSLLSMVMMILGATSPSQGK